MDVYDTILRSACSPFCNDRQYLEAPLKHAGVFTTLAQNNLYRLQERIINSPFILLYKLIACTCLFSDAKYFKPRIREAYVNVTQTQSHFPYSDVLPSTRLLRLLCAAAFVTLHNPSR